MEYLPYLRLVLIALAVTVEATTAQLVSIWFVVGGIAALIGSLFSIPFAAQLTLYVIFTALALIASRPFVKRVIHTKKVETNADRCIGQTGLVTEEINNRLSAGQVKVLGNVWSAQSADGSVIPAGKNVRIGEMQGVRLIVEPVAG